jgi:hypothetical protein
MVTTSAMKPTTSDGSVLNEFQVLIDVKFPALFVCTGVSLKRKQLSIIGILISGLSLLKENQLVVTVFVFPRK